MFDDLFIRVAGERLADEADAIAACGAGPEIYIKAERIRDFTPRTVADFRRILRGFRGHTVHAPFMDVWPGAADDDVRLLSLDKMRRVMAIAAELGSTLVVMHFNYDPIYYRQQVPQWLERAAAFFMTLLAEHDGPLIALENIAEPTPHIVLQLMKKAASPRLVHCFDFGHHHVFARIPFEEWLFYLSPQGHIHFHLHDNRGDHDDHLAMGSGSIDWHAAKAAIASLSCPFSITLEPKSAESQVASIAYYKSNFQRKRISRH
ncbi:MAG: sugar phosphate isomerase/epimerase [Acidobacteriota bacterium]|nr:sugar phosphate isomerase/epimerase [Acidobacteriota bacterium]